MYVPERVMPGLESWLSDRVFAYSRHKALGSRSHTATTKKTKNKKTKGKAPLHVGALLHLLSKTYFTTKELPC